MAFNYNWTPDYIYSLDFYDALLFHRRAMKREEAKVKSKLRMLQLLTTAIHTVEPEGLIEELENVIEGEVSQDEIGDLEGLGNLKIKRTSYRRAGDM